MYIKPYKKGDPIDFIEKSFDETAIHTTHLDIGQSSISDTIPIFPNSIPIDLLCIPDAEEKKLFIVYSPFMPKGKPVTISFVVDNESPITFSSLQPTNNEEGKHHHNEKHLFPITYNHLVAFCNAKSLKYQIQENYDSKMDDGEDIIPLCKLLFNTVFEKERFPETADYLQEKQKELSIMINKPNNNN